MKYHLDSEYRRRWEEYHLADGKVLNSYNINWRQVEWEKVIKLVASIEVQRYEITLAEKTNFKFFMRFRWGGQEAQFDKQGHFSGYKPINIWTVGWSDGINCYLRDINFYDGKFIKEYQAPLTNFKQHIHPRIKNKFDQICQLH